MLLSLLALPFLLLSSANATVMGKDLFTGQNIEVTGGTKGSVVVFLSARCPCSNSHIETLKALANEFKDFKFVGVHSNLDEGEALSQAYFKKADLPFAILQDEGGRLADEFKALKTPHAFLLSPSGKILYKGGVTDSNDAKSAERQYLREALVDVQAGVSVRTPFGRTLGCIITRGQNHVW